jgi:hypothetical protein
LCDVSQDRQDELRAEMQHELLVFKQAKNSMAAALRPLTALISVSQAHRSPAALQSTPQRFVADTPPDLLAGLSSQQRLAILQEAGESE